MLHGQLNYLGNQINIRDAQADTEKEYEGQHFVEVVSHKYGQIPCEVEFTKNLHTTDILKRCSSKRYSFMTQQNLHEESTI